MNERTVNLPKSGFICEACGDVGFPKTRMRGSFLITVLLLLLFIVPGLIYEAWRYTTRSKVCPSCGAHMIPIRSPRGRLLAQQLNPHVKVVA